MKNFLFGLIAIVLFSVSSSAATTKNEYFFSSHSKNIQTEKIDVVLTVNNNETINLKFDSYEEFEKANLKEIAQSLTSQEVATCTASVSVTASVGVVSVTVSFSVEVDCANLVNETLGLYKKAKQAIALMM